MKRRKCKKCDMWWSNGDNFCWNCNSLEYVGKMKKKETKHLKREKLPISVGTSVSISLKPSTSIFPIKKKTKTKVKNGGKTKSIMAKNSLYNPPTTLLPEKYPYQFIKYEKTWLDRFVDWLRGK